MNIRNMVMIAVAAVSCVSCSKFFQERRSRIIEPRVLTAATKGITNTTGSINTAGQTIAVDAFYLDGPTLDPASSIHYINRKDIKCDGSKWNWDLAAEEEEPEWVNGKDLTFWSFYPRDVWFESGLVTFSDDFHKYPFNQFSFSYSLPAPTGLDNDAENQVDLIIAFNQENREFDDSGFTDGKDQYFDIKFCHLLSKIIFDLSGVNALYRVTNIKIKNVSGEGSASINATGDDFYKVFAGDYGPGNSFTYSQDYDMSTDFGSNLVLKEDSDKFFYMIPGNLLLPPVMGNRPSIAVTFFDGTNYITKEKQFGAVATDCWEAGKYYKYKIRFNGEDFDLILAASMDIDDWDETSDINLDL